MEHFVNASKFKYNRIFKEGSYEMSFTYLAAAIDGN